MKKKLLISFSGGRTSAYMTKLLLDNYQNEYEMIIVFANTGKEREETFDFILECEKQFGFKTIWIEAVTNPIHGKGVTAKVVTYETASRNGEPFEASIAKHGIPSVKAPHCTRELKRYAIRNYAKSIGWKDYWTAIGYRVDEIDRVPPDHVKQKILMPLISYQHGITKNDVNKFWSQQNFDLKLKTYEGNCDLCYKKSFRKLMTLIKENPTMSDWWLEMENKYDQFVPATKRNLKPPIHFFRLNKSTKDIIDMAKNKFDPAKDESNFKREYRQTSLWGVSLDSSNGCNESCEVF